MKGLFNLSIVFFTLKNIQSLQKRFLQTDSVLASDFWFSFKTVYSKRDLLPLRFAVRLFHLNHFYAPERVNLQYFTGEKQRLEKSPKNKHNSV